MTQQQLTSGLVMYVILVFVITVHEWAHAWTADRCGDPTARLLGRMTLNPLAHIDMVGTVLLPLLALFGPLLGLGALAGIIPGWGKPVPVNPRNFRQYLRDDVLVSLAGPLSNVIITCAALLIVRVLVQALPRVGLANTAAAEVVYPLASVSFFLGFFNLLPIPPLDGSHLLRSALGYRGRQVFDRIGSYGFVLLIVLINTPVFGVFGALIEWLFSGLTSIAMIGMR